MGKASFAALPILFLIVLMLLALTVKCQQPLFHWYKTYGSLVSDFITKNVHYGSSLYVTGYTGYIGTGNVEYYDIIVGKVNLTTTDFIWLKKINDGEPDNRGYDVVIGADGYMYVTGYVEYRVDAGIYKRVFLAKINPNNGDIIWFKAYRNATTQFGKTLLYYNGHIYLAYSGYYNGYSGFRTIFADLNANDGSVNFAIFYGAPGTMYEEPSEMIMVNNYIYIVGYLAESAGKQYVFKAFILKISPQDGLISWLKAISGDAGYELGSGITYDSAGNLYIIGTTTSYGAGGKDVFVAKVDPDTGDIIWFKTIGGSLDDYGWDIFLGPDGYLYVVGETSSFGAGGVDGFIAKLDTNGNLLKFVCVGGSSDDFFNGILTANYYLYVSGYTLSYGEGDEDFTLMLYSPSISNQLEWTGGEGWDPVSVADYTGVVVSNEYSITTESLTRTLESIILEVDDRTLSINIEDWAPVTHLATDNVAPVPIPESALLILVLIATYFVLRKIRS